MRQASLCTLVLLMLLGSVGAQESRIASPEIWRKITNEASGELAWKDAAEIAKFDRLPGSPGFAAAADWVANRAREYGLSDVAVEKYPADGKVYYNTFRSDLGWVVHGAELWIEKPAREKLVTYAEENLSLGWYSRSADVTAPVVDIGRAATDPEFAKLGNIEGKILLTTGPWNSALELGVEKRGAAGVIFYSSLNRGYAIRPQRTSWAAFLKPPDKGFLFVLSSEKGNELASRLTNGEAIVLHATVNTEVRPTEYEVVTGVIPGDDTQNQVILQAHLDHPAQSANDDAAGCGVLLNIARSWVRLIRAGELPKPRRTIRFLWQAEMSGTMAYAAKHPELPEQTIAGIRFGIIGARISTSKSLYNFGRSRTSAPTFVSDLGEMLLEKVTLDSLWWLTPSPLPLKVQAPTGSRDLFTSRVIDYFGEDDYTYDDNTTGFPLVGFNGGPDLNRHTSDDTMDKIDPTQLKRTEFLGFGLAWLATMAGRGDADWIANEIYSRALARMGADARKAEGLLAAADRSELRYALRDALSVVAVGQDRELRELANLGEVTHNPEATLFYRRQIEELGASLHSSVYHQYELLARRYDQEPGEPLDRPGTEKFRTIVPHRVPSVRGPMFHWTKDYLVEKLGPGIYSQAAIYKNRWWPSMTEEILNFIDGRRSVLEIRDQVSGEFVQLPPETVYEYLELLHKAGVISWK